MSASAEQLNLFDFTQYAQTRLESILSSAQFIEVMKNSRAAYADLTAEEYGRAGLKYLPPMIAQNAIGCTAVTAKISAQPTSVLSVIFGGKYVKAKKVGEEIKPAYWVFESEKIAKLAQNYVAAWALLQQRPTSSETAAIEDRQEKPRGPMLRKKPADAASTFSQEDLELEAAAIIRYMATRKLPYVTFQQLAAAKIPHRSGQPATAKIADIMVACKLLVEIGSCRFNGERGIELTTQPGNNEETPQSDEIMVAQEQNERKMSAEFMRTCVTTIIRSIQNAFAGLSATGDSRQCTLAMHHALTDLNRVTCGIKKYLADCLDEGGDPYFVGLNQYMKQFEREMTEFPTAHEFSVLREELKEKGHRYRRRNPAKTKVWQPTTLPSADETPRS